MPTSKWASKRTNDIRRNREPCSFQLMLINSHFFSLVLSLLRLCVCYAVCIRFIAVHCYRCCIIVFLSNLLRIFFLVRVIFNYLYVLKMQILYHKLLTSNENAVRTELHSVLGPGFFYLNFFTNEMAFHQIHQTKLLWEFLSLCFSYKRFSVCMHCKLDCKHFTVRKNCHVWKIWRIWTKQNKTIWKSWKCACAT